MRAPVLVPALTLFALLVVDAAPAEAQEDRRAGLFTRARQLPLVSQSLHVKVRGGDADLHLVQVFANDGADLAQADYRLPLPKEASVVGFGFWQQERFLEAKLQEKSQAEAKHQAAASEGRATGLAKSDGAFHSFSVYPIASGALQKVETTLRVPVVVETGTSHVRVPIDAFLGTPGPSSTVLVDLEGLQPLEAVDVEGAAATVLSSSGRRATLAFSAERAVDLSWREKGPPLLVHAATVRLDDGTFGTEVQIRMSRSPLARGEMEESHLLVDASFSMRARAGAVERAVERFVARAPGQARVHLIADRVVDLPAGATGRAAAEALTDKRAGHQARWQRFEREARRLGCLEARAVCAALVDGQLDDLEAAVKSELRVLVLADGYEYARAEAALARHPLVHKLDSDPEASLLAAVDEMVLPVLNVTALAQGEGMMSLPGRQDRRVAEGGMLRLFGVSSEAGPVKLAALVEGETLERTVAPALLDGSSDDGKRVRRAVLARRIEEWTAEHRRTRDPALRQRIVELSVKEGIPTQFTALQVDAPAPPPTSLAYYGSAAPEPEEWAAILLLAGMAAVALWRGRRGASSTGASA